MTNKPSGPHIEVAITGTLSRIDADGPDPLTYDESVDFVSSAADHLRDDDTLIDPVVSGHASTGESTVSFGVLVFIGAPELNGQLSGIFDNLHPALGWFGRTIPCRWHAGAPRQCCIPQVSISMRQPRQLSLRHRDPAAPAAWSAISVGDG